MKLAVASISLTIIFISFSSIAFDRKRGSALPGTAKKYSWVEATTAGRGCWPDCTPGQWCWSRSCSHYGEWPMTLVPLVAFNKLWMIGGKTVWSSHDGIEWAKAQSNAEWPERYGMTGVFFKDRLWKMGGMERSWDNFKNDVWYSRDGVDWKLATRNAAWSARRGHSALVFDQRLWVLGGAESSGRADKLPTKNLSEVWYSTDGINWTRATGRAPWSGSLNSVVFRNKMWVIGARGAWYSSDGRSWTQTVSNAAWLERGGNGAAGCLVFDDKIWFFGGLSSAGTLNDVWYSSNGSDWQQLAAHAPWTQRATENSVVFNDKLWIFGGKTGREEDGFSSTVWYMISSPAK